MVLRALLTGAMSQADTRRLRWAATSAFCLLLISLMFINFLWCRVNQDGQSKMSVAQGVDMWNRYLLPLRNQGYRLVSHSTNQAPDGLAWQQQWRSQCPACHDSVWAYSVHWYGTDANAFKSYVVRCFAALVYVAVTEETAADELPQHSRQAHSCHRGRVHGLLGADAVQR